MKIASDLDNVLAFNNKDRALFRPFKMHQFYAQCHAGHLCRIHWNYVVTGRKQCYRKITEKWLRKNNIQYGELVMFKIGLKKTLKSLCKYKSDMINRFDIEIYYEDDIKIAEYLRQNCSGTKIVVV